MSVFHGKKATVTFGSLTSLATSFTVTGDVPMMRATDMLDEVEIYGSGIQDNSASVETNLDTAGLSIAVCGETSDLVLDTTDGLCYTLTGTYCTGYNIVDNIDDVVKVSLNFIGGSLSAA